MVLEGVIAPIVTPRKGKEIDKSGLTALINHLIKEGVNGIFALSDIGEFTALTYKQKQAVIDTSVKAAAAAFQLTERKVPVIAGVTCDTVEESARLADYAATRGADFNVFMPIYRTFGRARRSDNLALASLDKFINKVKIKLPILLYNHFSYSNFNNLSIDDYTEFGKCSQIVGLIDTSGNRDYFRNITSRNHLDIYQGNEALMSAPGRIAGIVPYFANVQPGLCLRLFNNRSEELHKQFIATAGDIYQQQMPVEIAEKIKQELVRRKIIS